MLCRHCNRNPSYSRVGLCAVCCRKTRVRDLYPAVTDRLCRHCHKRDVNRPRGLCWTCYYTPGVRNLYPSTSKFAQKTALGDKDDHDFNGGYDYPLPDEPTQAEPGTAEKVLVMRVRVLRRQQLYHPLDTPMDPESYALGID